MMAPLIVGRIVRALLIVFALAGIPHLLRIILAPPPLSDLYPVWLGSRELLLHHRNPYSPDISREIQTAFYGAVLGPGDHPDQQCCFAYPVYVSFLLAPSVGSDFSQVRLVGLVILAIATAASIVWWYAATGRGTSYLVLTVPLVVISPPVMQGLDLRQLGLLVAALLAASAILAHRGYFALSGAALAFATIKPQMSVLPIAWMLLWALNGWAARKRLIIGFAGTFALLVGGGEFLLPGWISDSVAQLPLYRHYGGAGMFELLYGRQIGLILSAAFVTALLAVMSRRRAAPEFMPTLAFVLAIEVFVMPGLKSLLNLVLLIPGIFMLLSKYPAVNRCGEVAADRL